MALARQNVIEELEARLTEVVRQQHLSGKQTIAGMSEVLKRYHGQLTQEEAEACINKVYDKAYEEERASLEETRVGGHRVGSTCYCSGRRLALGWVAAMLMPSLHQLPFIAQCCC